MNYEQKFAAMDALAECAIKIRKPGDWYISQNTEIKDGAVLVSSYGNGKTPEEAIENHWDILNAATISKPIVTFKHTDNGTIRRHHIWNGFMWVDCTPSELKSA